jgi:molybdenum-dependent DNA-binding transcriptional regulator ModE
MLVMSLEPQRYINDWTVTVDKSCVNTRIRTHSLHICMAMDWEDLRFFLAVATAGSLSGAARVLNVNQATVSRRLAGLEAQLNVRLVDRLPRESRLTAIGQQILQDVMDIETKAFAIERKCSSSRSAVRTKVTITAPPILARHFLAPNLAGLARPSPRVQLSILSEPHFVSLSRMEADLALRLSPPIEDTDIVKKVGLMQFALSTHDETIQMHSMSRNGNSSATPTGKATLHTSAGFTKSLVRGELLARLLI